MDTTPTTTVNPQTRDPMPDGAVVPRSRIRVLTAGVAVAGIAATAGVGLYAAGGFAGSGGTEVLDATTDDMAQTPALTAPGGGHDTLTVPGDRANPGDRGAPPGFDDGAQPPTRGSGGGHAATGGS